MYNKKIIPDDRFFLYILLYTYTSMANRIYLCILRRPKTIFDTTIPATVPYIEVNLIQILKREVLRLYLILYAGNQDRYTRCHSTPRFRREQKKKKKSPQERKSGCQTRQRFGHVRWSGTAESHTHIRPSREYMEAATKWVELRLQGWENGRGSHPQHHRVWFKFIDLVTRIGSARLRCTEFEVFVHFYTEIGFEKYNISFNKKIYLRKTVKLYIC